MRRFASRSILAAVLAASAATARGADDPGGVEARADALLARMTVEEKVGRLG